MARERRTREQWVSPLRRDLAEARALEQERERNRQRARAAEERLWAETGADYAARQATPDDNGPNEIPVPHMTYTDDYLEDF